MSIFSALMHATPQIIEVADGWVAGLDTVNPLANDVIADTGPLAGGDYFVQVIGDTTVAVRLLIQRRNAASTATVKEKGIRIDANQTAQPIFGTKIRLLPNERIRVAVATAVTGTVQASILIVRVP